MRQLLLLLMLGSSALAELRARGSCSFVKESFCTLEHVCKSQSLYSICCECHNICPNCDSGDNDDTSCTHSDGQVYQNGERFVVDNCKHFECNNGVIRLLRDDSVLCVRPPNAYYCERTREDNACCFNYTCNRVTTSGYCRDLQGNIRQNGTTWTDPQDPCFEYICINGFISNIRIRCPPLPDTCTPVQVPGQCCPDCQPASDQPCIDRNGVPRSHGSTWQYPGQPCLVHRCNNSQIVTTPVDCPPRPTTGVCSEVGTPDQSCCPTYNCLCEDEHGDLHPNGSESPSKDNPCRLIKCIDGVIQYRIKTCPLPPPDQTCSTIPAPPNKCCPTFDCERPCRDRNGVLRQHKERWTHNDDKCRVYKCHDGVIFNTVTPCPQLPPNCRSGPPDGTCCPPPVCSSLSCIDDQGVTRAHGASWIDHINPCVRHTCTNGEIISVVQDCARPPPGCTVIPGTCCQYQCVQRSCRFQGRTYSHGEEFPDDRLHPCSFFRCNDSRIESTRPTVECQPLPPDCQNVQWPAGQCCRVCVDNTGGGSTQTLEELRSFIRGQFNVLIQILRLDAAGTRRVNFLIEEIGNTIDQIIEESIEQSRGIIILLRLFIRLFIELLQAEEPDLTTDNLNELLNTLDVLGQRLIRTTFNEMGRPTETLQNTLSRFRTLIRWLREFPGDGVLQGIIDILLDVARIFIAVFDLQGCRDDNGLFKELGSLYPNSYEDSTKCYMCKRGETGPTRIAVLNTTEHCPQIPDGCGERFPPNRCCPDPDCDDNVCIYAGVSYDNGDTWPNDAVRPCIFFTCDRGRIRELNRTDCLPTPPGCSNWYMDGVCCPKFDCEENPCFFNGEAIDDGVTKPVDPIRPCEYVTCDNGVLTTEDVSLDCPGPPQDFCRSRIVPYQCCPAYDCVTVNCTFDGVIYSEGVRWFDDGQYPCKQYECTKNGTIKILDRTSECPPQPHPLCVGERIEGECCKIWNCQALDCVFEGITYSNGQQWWDSETRRCQLRTCREGVVVLLQDFRPCPEVPGQCQPNYRNNECCHYKYTCPQCMFDPLGNLIPMQ